MEKPSLSSQEWPKLSPSPNEESLKKTELKNKKCDECTFVTHKTYNLKNHIFDFEVNFWHLHNEFSLSMTLKIHVILDHYLWYFAEMGKNFHDTNGEYVEAVHYSLQGHEDSRKFKVVRNIGTDSHLKKALSSHSPIIL